VEWPIFIRYIHLSWIVAVRHEKCGGKAALIEIKNHLYAGF
jgi:hypothetical protein